MDDLAARMRRHKRLEMLKVWAAGIWLIACTLALLLVLKWFGLC